MTADRRRSKKGKAWQQMVDHLRMVDPTIPADLAPRKPDWLAALAARPRPQRSAEDQALIDALRARQREAPALPLWHVEEDARGVVRFVPDALDEELAVARTMTRLGLTSEAAFWTMMHNVLEQCRLAPTETLPALKREDVVGLGPDDDFDNPVDWSGPDVDEERFNRLLGLIASFGPETEIEAQLAYQLALLQDLESEVLSLPAENVEQGHQKVNQALKVMGVKAQMIDRLHKLKQKGVQHVRVDHVIHAIASAADASTPALPTDPRDAVQRTIEQNARRVLGKPPAGPKPGSGHRAGAT